MSNFVFPGSSIVAEKSPEPNPSTAIAQLQALGYAEGDRIYCRAIKGIDTLSSKEALPLVALSFPHTEVSL